MKVTLLLFVVLGFFHSALSADTIRNCSCVAFRLDDIQDYYVTLQQKTIINLFETMKIPLSVGIIGNNWNTGDDDLLNAVYGALNRSRNGTCWRMEITNHGWTHESFPLYSLAEQTLRMNQTQQVVKNTLKYTMQTFMPPYNNINANTITAAKAVGYKYLTSEVDQDPAPYQYAANNTFFRFPVKAATGSTDTPGGWYVPVPSATSWSLIRSQLQLYGFAAVMMHPYEFSDWDGNDYAEAINQTTLNDLVTLLNLVKSAGLRLVLLNEIDDFFDPLYPNPCPSVATTAPATSGRLTTSPVTTAPITTGFVTTSPLTSARLTTSPLTSARLTTSPVTTSPLTTSPVTTSPLTSGGVTTSPLTTAPITSGDITTSPLTTGEITSGDITTSPLTTSPLTSADVTTSPVTTQEVTTSVPVTTGLEDITTAQEPSEGAASGVEKLIPIGFLMLTAYILV